VENDSINEVTITGESIRQDNNKHKIIYEEEEESPNTNNHDENTTYGDNLTTNSEQLIDKNDKKGKGKENEDISNEENFTTNINSGQCIEDDANMTTSSDFDKNSDNVSQPITPIKSSTEQSFIYSPRTPPSTRRNTFQKYNRNKKHNNNSITHSREKSRNTRTREEQLEEKQPDEGNIDGSKHSQTLCGSGGITTNPKKKVRIDVPDDKNFRLISTFKISASIVDVDCYVLNQEFYDREGRGVDFKKPKFSTTLKECCIKVGALDTSEPLNVLQYCEIRDTNYDAGKGVFAKESLLKGSYLPYFGMITSKLSRSPEDILMVYGQDYVIDSSKYRSKTYYVTPSCIPNAKFQDCMIDDDYPAMVIILIKDIKPDEEITVNYNWERGNHKFLSVCKCKSDYCKLFVEQDAAELMDNTIKMVKKFNTSMMTQFIESTLHLENKKHFLTCINKWKSMADQNDSFLFYWIYMLRNSVIHLCDRTGSKNENCGDCTKYIYKYARDEEQKQNEKEVEYNKKANTWVTNRNLAGHVIFTLNRVLSQNQTETRLQVYCNAPLRDLRQLSTHISLIKREEQDIFDTKLAKRLRSIIE
jgi:hypothetical protein